MNSNSITIKYNKLNGIYNPPPSKSHSFRALILLLHSKGKSIIKNLLQSDDVMNFVGLIKQMNGVVQNDGNDFNFNIKNIKFIDKYDFKNSGTALRFFTTYLAINNQKAILTGDEQLQTREIKPLTNALTQLGGEFRFLTNKEIPFEIIKGISQNKCSVYAKDSQFLSSLLLNLPFYNQNTEIDVKLLNEIPYVEMSLYWLKKYNIKVNYNDLNYFNITGNQQIDDFEAVIPADYSSASFVILASIINNSEIFIKNLDLNDPQGDKFILTFVESIGCEIKFENDGFFIKGDVKNGGSFDLNATPDLLPVLSIFASIYPFEFKFFNCLSARFKETDRIKVAYDLLKSINTNVVELNDGLIINGGNIPNNIEVFAKNDHRFIMGSSLYGLRKNSTVKINDIKNYKSSYPDYFEHLKKLGATVE